MIRDGTAQRRRSGAEAILLVPVVIAVAVGLSYLFGHALASLRLFRSRPSPGQRRQEPVGSPSPAGDRAVVEEVVVQPMVDSVDSATLAGTASAAHEEAPAVALEPVAEPAAEQEAPAKPKHQLRGLMAWAIYFAIIIGAIALGPHILGWALDTEHPMATISSGSMWPALKTGDIVLLQGVDTAEDLKEGDIIAFRHKGGLAIHRIVSIEGDRITTKGDANTKQDTTITFDNVIGRAVKIGGRLARIPYVGHLAELLGPVVGTSTDDPGQPAQSSSDDAGTAATGP